jgi:nitrite reductase/ring-hydroxylating ferredoxin subunit
VDKGEIAMMVKVAELKDLPRGARKKIKVEDHNVLLLNHNGEIYAIDEKCTHLGCSLSKGKFMGNNFECPCHGAVFSIALGTVVKGPATEPIAVYQVSVENGMITIKI